MSGTSMATPAAAGAVACVMGTSPSSACRYALLYLHISPLSSTTPVIPNPPLHMYTNIDAITS